jgi:hypothetical protein
MSLLKIRPRILKVFQQTKVSPCQRWIDDWGMIGKGRLPSERNIKRELSPGMGRPTIGWWCSRRDRSSRWWFPSSRLYLVGKGLHSLVQRYPSRIMRNMWSYRVKFCKNKGSDQSSLGMSRVDESSTRIYMS